MIKEPIMKTRTLFIMLFGPVFLALGACATLGAPQTAASQAIEAPLMVEEAAFEQEMVLPSEDGQRFDRSQIMNVNLEDRLVIRNANLELVVPDPSESATHIGRIAEQAGGFVVTLDIFRTTFEDGTPADQANITVRVPSESLSEVLEEIKSQASDVRAESISGQDVTQEYTDLQSQLRNLEAAEEELREIMGSMTKAEDVLDVYEHLIQIRSEIEVIKGRIQYLEQSSALSSISIQLIPDVAVAPLQIGRWQPAGTAKAAIEALLTALQILAQVAIWAALFVLPIILVIALGIWMIVKLIQVFRRRRSPGGSGDNSSPA
jgi:hypothetical protein